MGFDWNNIPSIKGLEFSKGGGRYNPLPGEIVPCLACHKPFLMRPYTGYPDQVCPECYQTYSECARIVCVVCRDTIAKVKPELLPSGFYIRPRMVLHINKCNVCCPGVLQSEVLEIARWEQAMGRRSSIVPIRTFKRK